jgi:hypothetical protein
MHLAKPLNLSLIPESINPNFINPKVVDEGVFHPADKECDKEAPTVASHTHSIDYFDPDVVMDQSVELPERFYVLTLVKELAEAGDATQQTNLGTYHYHGVPELAIDVDYEQVFKLYAAAAAQDNVFALLNLGLLHLSLVGQPDKSADKEENMSRGVECCRAAAEKGVGAPVRAYCV